MAACATPGHDSIPDERWLLYTHLEDAAGESPVRKRLAFLLAAVTAVWAQGPVGTLNGTVLDPAGLVVPGASVVATNSATGEEHKTTSTSAGAYTLPYVPSGTYKIRVKAPRFRAAEADNVILRVAQTLTVKCDVGDRRSHRAGHRQ